MKILIMCDIFDEGIGSQENILAKYFRKHGHQVSIVTSTFESVFDYIADRYVSHAPPKIFFIEDLKVIRLPYKLNLLNKVRSFDNAFEVISNEKPDMIFIMDIMPDLISAVKFKKENINTRIVMDYHADYSNSGKNWLSRKVLHGMIRKSILRYGMSYIDAIYPVTPGSADFLNDIYGVPRQRMELLPLGADMDIGKDIARRREGRELRARLGIAPDATVILSGGKFSRLKRTELLIAAVRQMPDLAVELVIVGAANIGEEEYAATMMRAAQGDSRIRFVGWLDNPDLFRFMDMADLAVFPASQSSLWVQAVSMGLPLVVGNTGGQDTSYMNAYDNIIELPRDEIHVDRLKEVIAQLVADPGRLAEMAEGARRTFREVLDWDTLVWKTIGHPAPFKAAKTGNAA